MSEFVGGYVNDIRDALLASVLSGQHAILLGAPGWGKTSIARSIAEALQEQWSFIRFDPSTPVEVIAGSYDPAAMLNGELKRIVTGTPYEPGTKVAVLDEVFRASEPMFDRLLDVLDRWDVPPDERPAIWGTANFVVSNERTEALVDRFALWVWLTPEQLDTRSLVSANLSKAGQAQGSAWQVPSWKEVAKVRRMTPGPNAVKTVANVIDEVEEEARQAGIKLHPRRKVQMASILFYRSAYDLGHSDFTECSPQAKRALRWCMPSLDIAEANNWRQIVTGVEDRVLGAIEAILAQNVITFKEVAGITDVSMRRGRVGELGVKLAEAQDALEAFGDDPRIAEAVQLVSEWFAQAARGEQIKRETI